MKLASYIAGLIGIAILTVLMVHQGLGEIMHVLGQAGFGLLWLVPFHIFPLLLDAQGWRVLLSPSDPRGRVRLPFLFWVATVREAVNACCPPPTSAARSSASAWSSGGWRTAPPSPPASSSRCC